MRYAVFFIVVLILVSGFIAYFGDLLGRKMGKKRLTLFNLRPRHTAIVVTTITGMLISAIALTSLLIIDTQFRKVLTHGKQILNQNKMLTASNISLEDRNRKLAQSSAKLVKEVSERKAEVVKAQKAVLKAVTDRNTAIKSVGVMKREIAARQAQLSALKKRSDMTADELLTRTLDLLKVQRRLAAIQSNLSVAQKELSNAFVRLTSAQSRLSQTQDKVKEQETKLAEQARQIAAQQATLVQIGKENIAYERQALELRSGELVARQGDEILREVVSSKQSTAKIRRDIIDLLKKASDKVAKLGAMRGENGRDVLVVFQNRAVPEDVLIDRAMEAIASNTSENTVVQVLCARNSIKGEQASVDLRLYYNHRVFDADELIVQGELDGDLSEGRILLSVIDFLQTKVSYAAVQAGVIPVSNPDPRNFTGRNPQQQVDALMKLVDIVRSQGSRVRVSVFASESVYAAGPLNMDNMRFETEPVP